MRSTHQQVATEQPLEGLRLVVCGFELEQREHRGIAVFSKGYCDPSNKLVPKCGY